MRSGKYFFTSAGTRTLPTPTPAKTNTEPSRRPTASGATARTTSPAVIRTRAATVVRSSPKRRSKPDARSPKTAKQSGGTVPMRPATAAGTAKSSAMWSYSGESEATAERSEKAISRMPTIARVRPSQSGRAGADVTDSA